MMRTILQWSFCLMWLLIMIGTASSSSSSSTSSSSSLSFSSSVRSLAENKIADYEPRTDVTDQLAIDLDQKNIENLLQGGNFQSALAIYMSGAFSRPIAKLSLEDPLSETIPVHTRLQVKDEEGNIYSGMAADEAVAGSTSLQFLYTSGGCQIGGLAANQQQTDGCLPAESLVYYPSHSGVKYTYDPTSDNVVARTLASFSTDARTTMHDCGVTCPYRTYAKFYTYYDNFSYGHAFVMAAYEAEPTKNFKLGNMDFSDYSDEARIEIMEKAIVTMNVWMYVIREMEFALDVCQKDCTVAPCNEEAVHHWDQSVAFYVGSLEGTEGQFDGVLLHALADKRCQDFRTCSTDYVAEGAGKTSRVNVEIMRLFRVGQTELLNRHCTQARDTKEAIEKIMAVPLIQGTLRYAWILDFQSDGSGDREEAEGAIYAASVLPLVHACNPTDAAFIYDNMRAGFGDPDFKAVKSAFERNYDCLGITCSDVGGLWDADNGDYLDDASPCGTSGVNRTAALVGGILGGICAALLIVIIYVKCKQSSRSSIDHSFSAGEGVHGNVH